MTMDKMINLLIINTIAIAAAAIVLTVLLYFYIIEKTTKKKQSDGRLAIFRANMKNQQPDKSIITTFFTIDDAKKALEILSDIVNTYGIAYVSDYCNIIRVNELEKSSEYGWYNLNQAKIEQALIGWRLSLPPAKIINLEGGCSI